MFNNLLYYQINTHNKKLNYKIWHLEVVFFSVLITTDPIYEVKLTNQYKIIKELLARSLSGRKYNIAIHVINLAYMR